MSMDVDREKDPINVLRMESLLNQSQQYDQLLARKIAKDKEQAVPLIIMSSARALVSSRFDRINSEVDMKGIIRWTREKVRTGPEQAAAILMCLAVEISLMMDHAAVVDSVDKLDEKP